MNADTIWGNHYETGSFNLTFDHDACRLLIKCQQRKNTENENTVEAKQKKASAQTDSKMNEYQPNSQVTDDRSLQKIDQTFADDKGEAVLKDIKNINKTYDIGSIELTVREIKLIHLRPDYSMIDYFHVLTHDEEFDFVKVFVEIQNKSSEKVNFAPIALLKTNTGETFDWKKIFTLRS